MEVSHVAIGLFALTVFGMALGFWSVVWAEHFRGKIMAAMALVMVVIGFLGLGFWPLWVGYLN